MANARVDFAKNLKLCDYRSLSGNWWAHS